MTSHKSTGRLLLADYLEEVPAEELPDFLVSLLKVWRSRRYLVQLFAIASPTYPELVRLSVSRVTLQSNGRWRDGLSWDELYTIKTETGFENWYGFEVYPRACDLINIANMRHLWLIPEPLGIGWFEGDSSATEGV